MADEQITRKFGALVRGLRLERGLSQEGLAQLCGLHRNYIGAVERAERTPSIVTVEKLARALQTSPSHMFLALETDLDDPRHRDD